MDMSTVQNQLVSEAANREVVTVPASDVSVLDANEKDNTQRSFSTNGGVGVEARDVAAKVTLGTGDIKHDSSVFNGTTISGSSVNMTIANDNSKNNTKGSRFDKTPSVPQDVSSQQLGDDSMSR